LEGVDIFSTATASSIGGEIDSIIEDGGTCFVEFSINRVAVFFGGVSFTFYWIIFSVIYIEVLSAVLSSTVCREDDIAIIEEHGCVVGSCGINFWSKVYWLSSVAIIFKEGCSDIYIAFAVWSIRGEK